MFIAPISLVKGGYTHWFSKTTIGSGEEKNKIILEQSK
jgi:hypothetical protein